MSDSFTVRRILAITFAAAIIVAVPALKGEYSEGLVLATIIAHQVFSASVVGYWVWFVSGKSRWIGIMICTAITCVWAPFAVDILERQTHGDPTLVYVTTEYWGITSEYSALWSRLCELGNYQLRIKTYTVR